MSEIKVPLLNLKAQYNELRSEIDAAIKRVMESQQFILGTEVQALEQEIAAYSNTRHAIGCASGSDALLLSLMALDIKPDDEVITTPYTFFATAGSIARLGAKPIFVDIEPDTFNIDISKVEAAITSRTRAIIPVHLFGQCVDMNALIELANYHHIPIIEDAAQAIGSEDKGRRAGSIGLMGCLSFFPTKNLGGAGDGGMIVTSDDELAARLRILRIHGGATEYHYKFLGINSRLDALQAAILRVKLPHLDNWTNRRIENALTYNRLFAELNLSNIRLPTIREGTRHIFNQYVVRVSERRDDLLNYLRQNGVDVKIYYPVPLHLQECFHYLGHTRGDFPHAEEAAHHTLALPIYPELTLDQQKYVVELINRFYVQR
jgi:dTDP-4-amino-4,6-dideoxygalactose transaminase